MLKYTTTLITFSEIPDEVTLCVEISNCPIHCPGCHSKHLWDNIGTGLHPSEVQEMILSNKGISCICFMGGDAEPYKVHDLARYVHKNFPEIKTAWYSGMDRDITSWQHFDYIKTGPYIEEKGPINNPNTNQRLYQKVGNNYIDITYKFWKNDTNS